MTTDEECHSVQFKMVYTYASEKPINALYPVSQKFPPVTLETISMFGSD